ncbi:multicopper oxidase family protein [Granulicella mallensis]|uniref:FtsP/CotA-like multicopper oxidase with cupredoxin domain n=1 Tax=Granulicella mallensis TaxID=940614 RepID=A0A7W7ZLQ9_9BACT|nr:multicopper oxidase domain-containing protein [Granulicella mallensis]MBB5062213.1 FtsP/CotA-like multicopper oxidase with cupredoxin domain [Granulicella mallensis]
MRLRILLLSMFSALLCQPLVAQQSPQPFAAPPTLQEKALPGKTLSLALSQPKPGCNPSGDVTHNGNLVTLDLNVVKRPNKIYDPGTGSMDDVDLRSYGGCLTGPLIEVNPGNTLRVFLHNELEQPPPGAPKCPDGGPNCFSIINLHFHGMHVSPAGNSDNVLLNIAPKTNFQYEVNVPEDHPAGTFWYHAHRHGSTALQVASGASGVLIVRGNRPYTGYTPGDIDTILRDANNKPFTEQVFLFQQIPYACFSDPPIDKKIITNPDGTWSCPAGDTGVVENFNDQLSSPTVWDNSGRFTSINGVVQPAITNVKAGEIQRWRLIHGGIHDTVNLQIVPMVSKGPAAALALRGIFSGTPAQQAKIIAEVCPITQPDSTKPVALVPQFEIASDGLTRTAINPIGVDEKSVSGGVGSNFLQPGYRSDLLMVFPHAGTYCVLNQAATPEERANAGPDGGPGGQGPNETQLLATVIVKAGITVPTDQLTKYVEQTLVKNNKNLPANALKGLANGDLTPWRGMPESGPASNSSDPLEVAFYIGNLPSPPAKPTDPPGKFGFYINSKEYSPHRIDFTRQVGATEDWVLTSYGEPHIFHIHVNPFEVMDVTHDGKSIYGAHGECLVPPDSVGLQNQYCGMWHTFKDTVFVQNKYQVHIRTTYDRYIGEFVIHCHILDHEDGGMMTNVEIVPDLGAPGNGIGMPEMKDMDHNEQ